ncbi:MAG: hypothetical protein QNK23_11705 [Crocinitomicaceae bacterium]|nr:hypothetical protein [Crocinitomicaceae bacterium]
MEENDLNAEEVTLEDMGSQLDLDWKLEKDFTFGHSFKLDEDLNVYSFKQWTRDGGCTGKTCTVINEKGLLFMKVRGKKCDKKQVKIVYLKDRPPIVNCL